MRVSRCYATAIAKERDIWVVGGVTPSRIFAHPICCSLAVVDVYKSSDKTWNYVDDLVLPRHHSTAAFLGMFYKLCLHCPLE